MKPGHVKVAVVVAVARVAEAEEVTAAIVVKTVVEVADVAVAEGATKNFWLLLAFFYLPSIENASKTLPDIPPQIG